MSVLAEMDADVADLILRPAQTDTWLTPEIVELARLGRRSRWGVAPPRAYRVARWMNDGPGGLGYDFNGASCHGTGVWAAVRQGAVLGGCVLGPRDSGDPALWWPPPWTLEPIPDRPGVYRYAGGVESRGGATVTVARIWVHPAHRQQGWARRLLDTITAHLGVPIRDLGWTAPLTPDGQRLARRLCPDGIWLT